MASNQTRSRLSRTGRRRTRPCPSRYVGRQEPIRLLTPSHAHTHTHTPFLNESNVYHFAVLCLFLNPNTHGARTQLYASSLTGQGLSLEVSFVKTLEDQGNAYGKELEAFKKAVKGKDKGKVRVCVCGYVG